VKQDGEPLSIAAAGDANGPQKVINFYGNLANQDPAWTLQINPRSDQSKPESARAGFSISDGLGTSRLFIDKATGNVGIGTTEPQRKLQIGHDVVGLGYDWGTSPNAGVLRFGDGTGWKLHFGRSREKPDAALNSGVSGVLMTIADNGNVGIGTDSPNGKLDVFTGGNGGWNRFVVSNTNNWGDGNNQYVTIGAGGAPGIMIHNPHVSWIASEKRASIRLGRSGGVANGAWWDIGTRPNNAFSILRDGGVSSLYISENGNVGIGTETPLAKLAIIGTGLITNGNTYAVPNGRMASGSLSIGSVNASYGGGNNWNENTAGLLLETAENTEIAVHDSGNRVASLMYYEGGAANRITIGRDMAWGPISSVVIKGGIHAGNSDIYFTNTEHNHTGFGNNAGYAAIENSKNYDALMILGRAGTDRGRKVRLWDYLQVNGDMEVTSRIGTNGLPATPKKSDWGGGIHTWDVEAEGTIWSAHGIDTKPHDLAENYYSEQELEAGDVVILDGTRDGILRSDKPADRSVLGVISTEPGVLLNAEHDDVERTDDKKAYPLALCGRVPCKVTDENGPINPGDLLVSSSTPGHAMKAKAVMVGGVEIYTPGTVIGKALEPLSFEKGVIEVFVFLR